MVAKNISLASFMRDNYEQHLFYKVFYVKGGEVKYAFFEDKEVASDFAKDVNGNLNSWCWEGWIEK